MNYDVFNIKIVLLKNIFMFICKIIMYNELIEDICAGSREPDKRWDQNLSRANITVRSSTVQYGVVHYSTEQYITVQSNTLQYRAVYYRKVF